MIYGTRSNGGEHGTVYTRTEVVDLILDLSGLNSRSDFLSKRVLDPAVGEGAFILELLQRIVKCFISSKKDLIKAISNITVVELDPLKCELFLNNVRTLLDSADHEIANYGEYINVINYDYLLAETDKYDVIIGNPPYVRYDNIPIEKIEM